MSIKLGVSACLLGHEVRYNGGHKRSHYIQSILSEHFELIPLCPEVGIGMGTPRPPIHLIATEKNNEVFIEATEVNDHSQRYTLKLKEYAKQQAEKLQHASGYIFMQKSPSCGYKPVKLYHENGMPLSKTQGIYAAELDTLLPLMPKEDAGRLNDAHIRENFLARVSAYADWQKNVASNLSKHTLTQFHVRYKYTLMSHHIASYQSLGRLLSDLKSQPLENISEKYIAVFMTALTYMATRKTHTNVLQHLQGYLKQQISSQEKSELNQIFTQYRKGHIPLIVPLTMLNHFVQKHTQQDSYLRQQKYLNPHNYQLALLNAI